MSLLGKKYSLIVCWFLKFYQDLKKFAAQEQRKTGKNPEINRQSFVIWWHNSKNIDLSDIYEAVRLIRSF